MAVERTIVVDRTDDTVREARGGLPNSAYLLAKGGPVALKEPWAQADRWALLLDSLWVGG